MFHFTELKAGSNSLTKGIVIYHGNNSGNNGYCEQRITYSWKPSLLKLFFFYLGLLSWTFVIHRTTGEGGGYLLITPHGGQTFLDKEFMGGYSKWKD